MMRPFGGTITALGFSASVILMVCLYHTYFKNCKETGVCLYQCVGRDTFHCRRPLPYRCRSEPTASAVMNFHTGATSVTLTL